MLIEGSTLVSRRVIIEEWELGDGAGGAGGSLMTKGLLPAAKQLWLYPVWKGEHTEVLNAEY